MTVLQTESAVRSGVRPGVRTTGRIPVVVHAADPISRAGAVSQLKQCPGVELVDEPHPHAGAGPGAVAVVLTETVDAAVAATLRRLVRGGEARVVLVVERMREAELLEAVECGVAAILWRREATAPRLGQAVLAASRGEGDLPADLLGRLITQMGRLRRSVQGLPGFTPPGVTEREADILRLVAEGWDTAEIAAKLSYSERTVKNVLHGLTTRLHLRNRAHAVAYALREGYI
ncbi:LuxR C-terminal-related transcriptional regulator [Kitasatospora sp. NPDC057015]|uniref:helix-turn-helix transcriptional regulator n=1 Tax=Kitasatospora sp. NPDC057015 TaxID=3346001 RepID=UPI00363E62F6